MASDGRLPLIDVARTGAIVAMVIFHFGRDLDVFGVWPPGSTFTPAWIWAARLIAGTFVCLAGMSLWLAHGRGIRWRAFLDRLLLLVLGAAAVSVATYLTFPGGWVRYGILHSIAVSSVIGLAFLRVPALVTLISGGGVIWIGATVSLSAFSSPWMLWTGLGPVPFPMMDYEPIFPWTGPFLIGLGLAKLLDAQGVLDRLRGWPKGVSWHRIGWPGRQSLAVYLIHQPLLIGGILAYLWLVGAG